MEEKVESGAVQARRERKEVQGEGVGNCKPTKPPAMGGKTIM